MYFQYKQKSDSFWITRELQRGLEEAAVRIQLVFLDDMYHYLMAEKGEEKYSRGYVRTICNCSLSQTMFILMYSDRSADGHEG